MTDDAQKGTAVGQTRTEVPTSVSLSPTATMDLAWLGEEERKALLVEHSRGMLDLSRKAQELHVDVNTLKNTLDQLATTTREVSEAGNSVGITHTQTTKIGRTEVTMGNTKAATEGRLTSSQTGERDMRPYYIIGALIAVVLVAALVGN